MCFCTHLISHEYQKGLLQITSVYSNSGECSNILGNFSMKSAFLIFITDAGEFQCQNVFKRAFYKPNSFAPIKRSLPWQLQHQYPLHLPFWYPLPPYCQASQFPISDKELFKCNHWDVCLPYSQALQW